MQHRREEQRHCNLMFSNGRRRWVPRDDIDDNKSRAYRRLVHDTIGRQLARDLTAWCQSFEECAVLVGIAAYGYKQGIYPPRRRKRVWISVREQYAFSRNAPAVDLMLVVGYEVGGCAVHSAIPIEIDGTHHDRPDVIARDNAQEQRVDAWAYEKARFGYFGVQRVSTRAVFDIRRESFDPVLDVAKDIVLFSSHHHAQFWTDAIRSGIVGFDNVCVECGELFDHGHDRLCSECLDGLRRYYDTQAIDSVP